MCPIFLPSCFSKRRVPTLCKRHTTTGSKPPHKICFRQNILASHCSPTAILHLNSDHCAESHMHLKGSAWPVQKPFENKLLHYWWWTWQCLLIWYWSPCTKLIVFHLTDFVSSWWGIKYQLEWKSEVWQVYHTDANTRNAESYKTTGAPPLHRLQICFFCARGGFNGLCRVIL